ncbi:MAG: hypothetical protein MUP47_09190 [Phycisphaerae bacterium]|nr:hypothetical protein [Phycisphaerae bacterium]
MRGSLPTLLRGAMVAVLLVAGCSDSKRHGANKKLLEETEIASRRYAKAVSLMDLPPAKVNDEYVPLGHVGRITGASNVKLADPLAVHPEAWAALVAAETGLTRALGQYGRDAGNEDQALAQAMLGNILMLKAEYQRAAAAAERQQARAASAMANRSVSMVQLYTALERYYDQLASLRDQDLSAVLSAAREEAAKARVDAEAVQKEIASLRARAEQLRQADEALIPQARRLRGDSEQASGQEAMELLDQALKLETQINENVSALAALENALERREADLSDVKAALESAEARQKVAETIVAARRGHADASRTELGSIQAALSKARSDVQEQTALLASVCERTAQAEDAAAEAYTIAIAKHEAARRLRTRNQSTQTIARLADARWALAELKDQSLYLRQCNMQLAERLAGIGSPRAAEGAGPATTSASAPADRPPQAIPAFAKGLLAYVPNPEQTRSEAIENYTQAGELYETASRGVLPHLRWAYQGQAAAAYIALYRLSYDADALTKAKEALNQALEDKRESPFLASVVELERLLQLSTPRPRGEPTTTPE